MTDAFSIAGRVCSALAVTAVLSGCGASAPVAPAAPVVAQHQKLTWILQLEDQRILRFELPPPPAPAIIKGRAAAPTPPPTSKPDLAVLVTDAEGSIRRRAALAVGRVGLSEGATILVPLLADADAEVRQMAAFALGLLGVALEDGPQSGAPQVHAALVPAVGPLTGTLADPDPRVRGRAAEALGQIGARDAAAAIGKVAAEYARSAAVTAMQPDDEKFPASPEADAFRLAIFALVRLRAYEPLAAAVLDPAGRPVSNWWPVAYALQRVGDPRAVPALRELLRTRGVHTASFAARGLGASKDPAAAKVLLDLLDPASHPAEVVVVAIRGVAALGAADAAAPLARLAAAGDVHPNLRLEAVRALGILHAKSAEPIVQDLLTDPWPAMRAEALRAAALIDRDSFMLLLSGLDPDQNWSVRAALADVLGTMPADIAVGRLRDMLSDEDKRVIPPVLNALTRHRAPDAATILLTHLKDHDPAVREAAARNLAELKPAGAVEALRAAYKTALADPDYSARGATLRALGAYGAEAVDTVKTALADKDWALRLRAASLLGRLTPGSDYADAIRPAPGTPPMAYANPQLRAPDFSPHAFIETAKGTIEMELAVLDAPQTSQNFITLARKGFFNGAAFHRVVANFVIQDGDPRGDGGGGPGYTIRDELNDRPYLRGTVGMALSGRDDAGSQFFITHSPQPHLDGRYTVFGHVVNGMDVVDRIQQGDTIVRIRIWDGKTMQ